MLPGVEGMETALLCSPLLGRGKEEGGVNTCPTSQGCSESPKSSSFLIEILSGEEGMETRVKALLCPPFFWVVGGGREEEEDGEVNTDLPCRFVVKI